MCVEVLYKSNIGKEFRQVQLIQVICADCGLCADSHILI